MYCIVSEHTDPYFNLASEEYLLREFSGDVFLLYRNKPSIIVGKHQNTLAEINLPVVRKKGILVARRISGGGTVYHDLGNLVFAFITTGAEDELVDYRKHTRPIIEAMQEMGLPVRLGPRHELLLGGSKISGTASHVFKQRALHHGTLLYSSRLNDLTDALAVHSGSFQDKSVKSVRSRVTNIRDHLEDQMDLETFRDRLLQYVLTHMPGAFRYRYTGEDEAAILRLRNSKFSTWEWNYGYSPKYRFSKKLPAQPGEVEISMDVKKGIIQSVTFRGGSSGMRDVGALEELLTGALHDPETLRLLLDPLNVGEYIPGLENDGLLSGLF